MGDPSNPEGLARGVLAAGLTVSGLAAILRFYTQVFYVKTIRIEDYIALAGFGTYIALAVFIFRLVDTGGLFVHAGDWDDPAALVNFVYIFFVGANVYHVTLLLLKAAILLEWVHIFVPRGTRNVFFWTSYIILATSTVYYVVSLLVLNLSCTPRERYWDMSIPGTCLNISLNNEVTAIFNLFFDVVILVLPHMIIWSLNMRTALKLGVSVIFIIGLLACTVAAIRVVFSSENSLLQDVTYQISSIALLVFAETTAAILVFCAPAIPRALKQIWEHARSINSNRSGGSRGNAEGYSWPKRSAAFGAYRSIHDRGSAASGSVRVLASDFAALDDLDHDTGTAKRSDPASRSNAGSNCAPPPALEDNSPTGVLGRGAVVLALIYALPLLSGANKALLNGNALLPAVVEAMLGEEGFQHGEFIRAIELDIAPARNLGWPANSPSVNRIQQLESRPLAQNMGPLSRLGVFAVEHAGDSNIVLRIQDELLSFTAGILEKWEQCALSLVDLSVESVKLPPETLQEPWPLLWQLLNKIMFAVVAILQPTNAPNTAELSFISSRQGVNAFQIYTFTYLTSLDIAPALTNQAQSPSLNASAFLLDFLYPTGAVALMRNRLSPAATDQFNRLRLRSRSSHVSPRLYNSSLPHRPADSSSSAAEGRAGPASVTEDHEGHEIREGTEGQKSSDLKPRTKHDSRAHAAAIERILKSRDLDAVDSLWRHYKSLDEHSQNTCFRRILAFLSRTGRVSDSWKISELFHMLEVSSWDDDTFVAGVSAEINLQNPSQALSIFERGLRSAVLGNSALVGALDLLLSSAIRSPTSELLEEIWNLYPEMASRWDFGVITADLERLASVPGIVEKAMAFPQYVSEQLRTPSGKEIDLEALQVLHRVLVRRALVSCEESQVIPLLLLTKDPLAFEEYLKSAEKRRKRKVSTDVYAIYRELPGNSPSHAALHCVFSAYTKTSTPIAQMIVGVELIWDDWHRFHTVPSRRAFQRHLAFYANQGNKERVYALWIEYVERFRDDPTVNIFDADDGSDTFAHLLQVHAVNAEPEKAQEILNDMMNKFKMQPSTYDWNILLNAYAKAGDYDGAIGTFDSLCEATVPDQYSYGTLMQLAGSRGDLGFTVDLYRRARSSRIPNNDAMLSSLIDAYCQNDLFSEAEDVCTRAASKGIVVTQMWNKLLYYNAQRRDLAGINKILNTMAEKNIPYNQFTYQQLLLGLALCRQSQHALHLLAVAIKDDVFKVTAAHFQIVMGALLRTGEPILVRRLCILMNERGIPVTEDILFRLSQALGQWKDFPPKVRYRHSERRWLGGALRTFFQIFGRTTRMELAPKTLSSSTPVRTRELLRSGPELYQFRTMMCIFAELNDSVQVNELVDLYRYVFQDGSDDKSILPLPMLDAVMLSSLQDKRYDRVRSTWRLLFENAKVEARSADFRDDLPSIAKISPKYRYVLSKSLRVMQEMLLKENNFSGLQQLINEVREAGFEVDSKNWNYHVQILVQMRQYKVAFTVCEKILMPNWTGWYLARLKEAMRNSLPLDTRRKGSSPRYMRPTAATLYRLAQAYLELDKQSPWSHDAAATLLEVESECTQVVRAIKSMSRVHSALEDEIFSPAELTDTIRTDELGEEEAEAETEAEERPQTTVEGA
ncbi:hypothetical protein NUW58_g1562 [Xylaria curta]|uniref:Uncharacterized protein n=1 Tax=Xylaria curta TaxID=42375 RepID=A0ACC1PMX8_9PEZI|nr:hypothetical protein NUW58_g1562 [Xylaria curta]